MERDVNFWSRVSQIISASRRMFRIRIPQIIFSNQKKVPRELRVALLYMSVVYLWVLSSFSSSLLILFSSRSKRRLHRILYLFLSFYEAFFGWVAQMFREKKDSKPATRDSSFFVFPEKAWMFRNIRIRNQVSFHHYLYVYHSTLWI